MDSFKALYIVWTLEPDYAKKNFIDKYKDLDGFIDKYRPNEQDLKKAKKILNIS